MKEIEAKFSVPDRTIAEQLRTMSGIGRYAMSPARQQQLRDTYFDTAERHIFQAGYALRAREVSGSTVITLKALRGGSGTVRRREEIEVTLPSWQPPNRWPVSPLRDFILATIKNMPVIALFDLRQTRWECDVTEGKRLVAAWSSDEVLLQKEDDRRYFFVLEIELRQDGKEADLQEIVRILQTQFSLRPDTRTKLQHAQIFFADRNLPAGQLLLPDERIILQAIAARPDRHGRHAKALLALQAGNTQRQAAQMAGLSERRVRYWLAQLRQKRTALFPASIIDQALPPAIPMPTSSRSVRATPDANEAITISPVPITALWEHYHVNQRHARAVADYALMLFDILAPIHRLPLAQRALLEKAALVHDIGLATDSRRHHIVGRDMLLQNPVIELNRSEQIMVAAITFLHRKQITAKKLRQLSQQLPFSELPATAQKETLALAAIVRMADGLDFSGGTSRIGSLRRSVGLMEINIAGAEAMTDASRAQRKADLWALLFPTKVVFRPPMSEEQTLTWQLLHPVSNENAQEKVVLPSLPGVAADDLMCEAARKIIRFHFWRMLYHEPAVRAGDADALHDMRVAVRRMRVAIHVLSPYLDMGSLRPFNRMLQHTGRSLGQGRDLDVFWEHVECFLQEQSDGQVVDLSPLRAAWTTAYAEARTQLLVFLNKTSYRHFKAHFAEFLGKPWEGPQQPFSTKGDAFPRRVRQLLPVLVAERQAYLLAYEEWLAADMPLTRYHRLRIAAKYFRYTLEYFREVLGPEAKPLIREVVALQDHLGQLQDAVVAIRMLRNFLTWGALRPPATIARESVAPAIVVAPDVAVYSASRQKALQQRIETFLIVWKHVNNPDFRKRLANLLTDL